MMKDVRFKAYILILVLTFANISWGEYNIDEASCTTKDMTSVFGPIRFQGNIGWCYANVAADLITYKYKNYLHGERASAAYVALAYNQFMGNKPNDDAGDVIPAILASEYFGVCPDIFEQLFLQTGPFTTLREKINKLVELKELHDIKDKSLESSWAYQNLVNNYYTSNSLLSVVDYKKLEKILINSTKRNFPRKLADLFCNPIKVKIPLEVNFRFRNSFIEGLGSFGSFKKEDISNRGRDKIIEILNQEISKNKPVAVAFNSRIFYKKDSDNYKGGGSHVVVIAGRKWNKKEKSCEFILRNSHGKRCDIYSNPELEGKCDLETGYLMMPAGVLNRTISEAVYFWGKGIE